MVASRCERCSRGVPGFEGVYESDGRGGGRFLCGRCWTEVLSEAIGEDVEHIEVAPMTVKGTGGRKHEFHFRYNPAPRSLEALEVKKGEPEGYEFAVMGGVLESNIAMVGRLLAKIRRGIARRHLKRCDITEGGLQIKGRVVRGRIAWDEKNDGRVACVVVDGKTLSWRQLGAMLMTFEGWDFRLEIFDRSEDC